MELIWNNNTSCFSFPVMSVLGCRVLNIAECVWNSAVHLWTLPACGSKPVRNSTKSRYVFFLKPSFVVKLLFFYDWITLFVAWQKLYFCKFDFAFVSLPICQLKKQSGISLAVQWLRLHTSTAGGTGSIPRSGTRITHATVCGQKKERKKKSVVP